MDGSKVVLDGPFSDLGRLKVTSFAVFDIDGRHQEFGAGDREFGSDDATELGIKLDEKYRVDGVGTVRVGYVDRFDEGGRSRERLHYGVWEGTNSSIRAGLYNATSSDLLALFERFAIHETDEGPMMQAKDASVKAVNISGRGPCVLHEFEPIGLIDVAARTSDATSSLEAINGHHKRPTPHGTLFTGGLTMENPHLSLVTSSAMASIAPFSGWDLSKVEQAAAELDIRWQGS